MKVWLCLVFSLMATCCGNDGIEDSSNSDKVEIGNDDKEDAYQVNFYDQDPGLNTKQGYWAGDGFITLTPENKPPYHLLVTWNNEQGKRAIDNILKKYPDVITEKMDTGKGNEYRITSNKYMECPDFFVSSAYKSSEFEELNRYDIWILPQVVLKMEDDGDVEDIKKAFTNSLTFVNETHGLYYFDCNLKTSREVLQLASEIHTRNDVKWSEPNMYLLKVAIGH